MTTDSRDIGDVSPGASADAVASRGPLTHHDSEEVGPTTTQSGGTKGADAPRRARSRAIRREPFEIIVTGEPRPDLNLDLIAQALLIVARELASKGRTDTRD